MTGVQTCALPIFNARALYFCFLLLGLALLGSIRVTLTDPIATDDLGIPLTLPGSPGVMALLAASISSFCYLGTMLERSTREKTRALKERLTIFEKSSLETQLQRQDRIRRLVLASGSLAHELNQPLTSALTRAQLAQRELERASGVSHGLNDLLNKALASIWRCSEILDRIRSAAQAKAPPKSALDLREVVHMSCEIGRAHV